MSRILETISDKAKMEAAIRKGIQNACLEIERDVKMNCPVSHGTLRRSITSTMVSNNEGLVFTPLEYAPYVEFGTGIFAADGDGRDTPWSYQDEDGNWHTTLGQPPQPFMFTNMQYRQAIIANCITQALVEGGAAAVVADIKEV